MEPVSSAVRCAAFTWVCHFIAFDEVSAARNHLNKVATHWLQKMQRSSVCELPGVLSAADNCKLRCSRPSQFAGPVCAFGSRHVQQLGSAPRAETSSRSCAAAAADVRLRQRLALAARELPVTMSSVAHDRAGAHHLQLCNFGPLLAAQLGFCCRNSVTPLHMFEPSASCGDPADAHLGN